MKKATFLAVLLVGILSLPVFGLEQSEIDEMIAKGSIYNAFQIIDGTIPMFQGAERISPDTYLVRGTGHGGDERLIVIATNNFLGVVAVAITDTGSNSEETFRLYRRVVNGKSFKFENAVTNTNSIQGTVLRDTGGRRYRFSLDYYPPNKQVVITITRQ